MRPRSLLVLLVLSLPAPAGAEGRVDSRIVNGLPTSAHPSTGALLSGLSEESAVLLCSGTLVGCETFLTAAHCVAANPDPSAYFVFFQHAGFFRVSSLAIHPSFPGTLDATGDIAVLKLASPVTAIVPAQIDAGGAAAPGASGTIVGFGITTGTSNDAGLKREGAVTLVPCDGVSDDRTSLCWSFEDPVGPPGTDSNTCSGDSGGPLLVDLGCGDAAVAGVTSFGTNFFCAPRDLSVDASVVGHLPFLLAQGGSDLASGSCGSTSHVGDSNTTVDAFSGSLDSVTPQAVHSFTVAPGTTELRVGLNSIDDFITDFDLYLRRGAPPTASVFDCRHDGSSPHGYCAITSPAADTWFVLVDRFRGAGGYQVAATSLSASPGVFPGDGTACDDLDSCTEPDACASERCVGPSLPDGATCDDGNACTGLDVCTSASCAGQDLPATGCDTADAAVLVIRDRSIDRRDVLVWRWIRGTVPSFPDPTAGGDVALCVYEDDLAGGWSLVAFPHVRSTAAASWAPVLSGYRYRDRTSSEDGVRFVRLKPGVGNARIILRGKGTGLDLGPLPLAPPVRVQLLTESGCWESTQTDLIRNDVEVFKANQ